MDDLYFPADPTCYGCGGTGWLRGAPLGGGTDGPTPCICVQHEAGECEPESCSPECKRRAELREHSWTVHALHPDALDVPVWGHVADEHTALAACQVLEDAGCLTGCWPNAPE